jgi:hypothetical protein
MLEKKGTSNDLRRRVVTIIQQLTITVMASSATGKNNKLQYH